MHVCMYVVWENQNYREFQFDMLKTKQSGGYIMKGYPRTDTEHAQNWLIMCT